MPRADDTATSLTGVHGQSPQRIPPFLLISGRRVAAYVTKPNADDVDGRNPLHAIWSEHATSDDVRIARWEPTAQRMQPGKSKHKFFVAAAHCKTIGELRRVWESQGRPWRFWKFLFASRWILFTIDTAAARQDYARLKAAIEGLPAPAPEIISEPAEEIVSEDEAEDAPAPAPPAEESDDGAPLPAPEGDEGDEDDEPPPPVDEEDVAEAAPPALEDEEDEDMEDAEAPELLFREGDVVFARDGRDDYPATVVATCPVGASKILIKWRTGRAGQYDWPLSAVTRDLPPRRPRREKAPAAPRRAKAPPAPRPPRVTTFRVGDKVEARYLGDLGSYCPGTVAAINADGSFVIDFDDGDRDSNVRPGHVIARRPQLPAPVKNKRPPPRPRTEPAKRARPAPPPPQTEESDEEVEAPPPAPEEADEDMTPPPPPDDEGEEEDDGAGPALAVKIAATPTGMVVTPPVAAPRAPLQEGDDDDDESFAVGAKVEACWQGGTDWYPGTVVGVTEDGYDVAFDDSDREVVSRGLVREQFEVSAATDACGLKPGARVFSLFDVEDDRQDWWCGTVVDSADYYGQGQELHIVFDDGSDHRMWACDVARALPASIRETTLKVDRPNAKALALIDKLRRDPGAGRRRLETARLDAATLAAPLHPQRPRPPPAALKSTEICSGSGILSDFLRKGGVKTRTVDNDPSCRADVCRNVLDLPNNFCDGDKIIHLGPKCSTYSRLAASCHRSLDNPEGWSAEAKEANKVAEKLADILVSAKCANPDVLISVENPVGYMRETKFAKERLEKELGLTRLTICYCKFSFGGSRVPRMKPTDLWTNCPLLIANFGDGKFNCTHSTPCPFINNHRSVRPVAGSRDRASDSAKYPDEVARFLALMLINEARARSR